MDKSLKAGIIGLGDSAKSYHLPSLLGNKNFSVVCGAEKNDSRRERIAQMFNIQHVYPSFEEMLGNEELDAVYVCLPNNLHFNAVMAALEKGIHVLCEKPMGLALREAKQMADKAKEKNLVLLPGYNNRFVDNFLQAKCMIEHGLIGNILKTNIFFMNPGPFISADPKSEWHFGRDNGGVLYDIGSHAVNLFLFITQEKIKEIRGSARAGYRHFDVLTNISCSFVTENNIIGSIDLAWGSGALLFELHVVGTAGIIIVNYNEIRHYYFGTDPIERFFDNLKMAKLEALRAIRKASSKIKAGIDYQRLTQNFFDVITEKIAPVSTVEDALETHKVLEKISDSLSIFF